MHAGDADRSDRGSLRWAAPVAQRSRHEPVVRCALAAARSPGGNTQSTMFATVRATPRRGTRTALPSPCTRRRPACCVVGGGRTAVADRAVKNPARRDRPGVRPLAEAPQFVRFRSRVVSQHGSCRRMRSATLLLAVRRRSFATFSDVEILGVLCAYWGCISAPPLWVQPLAPAWRARNHACGESLAGELE